MQNQVKPISGVGRSKGGANYNLDEHNNVFANIGFISKAPFFEYAVFLNKENSNELNKDAVNEKDLLCRIGIWFPFSGIHR